MTAPSHEMEALRGDLTRRFRTTTRDLELAGRTIELLMPANADELISEQDFDRDERLPYWADLWPSARILAEELAVMRLAGQRVLELGCGLGVVAVGAVLGGAQVTATDYYEEATLFASLNVAAATGRQIATRMVNWVDMPKDLGKFDVVLASDVLYEHRYAPLVANAIATTLVRGGEAIVADPGRIALQEFLDECSARGLVHEADARPFVDGQIRQTVTLWRIRWRS
ncbi:MAG TPA: methyltransferase domain-containing protein [Gemmatimonadaceae bacterium]|nr:methyltransferase domain-containing protein [Gemmatimonadaceae bacterium]